MRAGFAAALLAAIVWSASGHRLDEYLQNTIVSVEKDRLHAQMVLTPGLSVFPLLIGYIDADGDGAISQTEQHAYAARVLHDISLGIDGSRLSPRLISLRFPRIDELKEGRGEIQLDFGADLPRGGRNRKVSFENHHQNRISAYQVNCLVSRDPNIRIKAQNRNYSQSVYELEYVETDLRSGPLSLASWPVGGGLLGALALLLLARLVLVWRQGLSFDRQERASSIFHSRS